MSRWRHWPFHINAHKTEYICLNQTGDISTLGSNSMKLVDKLTNQGSGVSSTEKDITRLAKVWTAIDMLLVIWKSDLTDKMKRSGRFDTAIWMHYMDADKTKGEKV